MSNELVHPELAGVHVDEDSADLSRSEVILKGALAVGAVYGVAMVGPFVRNALATSGEGDVDVLNFLLLLAYLESDFYEEAYGNGLGDEDDEFLTGLIGDYEPNHAQALEAEVKRLGGKPMPKPKFDFSYDNVTDFFKLAQTIQDTAVSAYIGAAPSIESREALATVGSIAQGEARFAAAVRLHRGQDPAPDAFDSPLDESQVLAVMEPFIQ